ncbi:sensor histidine kinase, partial [Frankia sp. EI5c]|uniref:sensor histidine kinase n=1 Tax=Frankia sp. EI5c TaxID=683316 RepID=UPI0037BEC7AE
VYFTAAELITNVSKHSGAASATVELHRAGDELVLRVTDDGRGGARVGAGSGLSGLAERLGALDGSLLVTSPAGGPTQVLATVPWRDREDARR